jgi:hypothetical protein
MIILNTIDLEYDQPGQYILGLEYVQSGQNIVGLEFIVGPV